MSPLSRHAYLTRETAVSGGINALISAGFFVLVFWKHDVVPVWGMGNYAFDFLPQSFGISLMSGLVPALLARQAVGSGRVGAVLADQSDLGRLFVRSLTNAAVATVLGVGLCVSVLWITGPEAIGLGTALILKIIYGAALGSAITRRAIDRLLV